MRILNCFILLVAIVASLPGLYEGNALSGVAVGFAFGIMLATYWSPR